MYYLKRYAVLYCVVNYEIASTSSQIYEQIEVLQDVVTPRKSKMNDSTRDKKQKKKILGKRIYERKMDLIWPIILLKHQFIDCVTV